MTYSIYFNLPGYLEIEADSEEEALEEFDRIDDYSEFASNTDPYDVFVEESR